MRLASGILAPVLLAASAGSGQTFVNWESPHVSPLDLTPDGSRLLAVNTADNRLEVFAVTESGLTRAGAVPVGLDPVSVRARTDTEAWVVNHISDTVSIVDLAALNVTATLYPGDEPADVVFAGDPRRAFVSVSQLNRVVVYDPSDLATPPVVLDLEGEDPRALATDGTTVYGAIFESGNGTTILRKPTVSSDASPYSGQPNPPPNSGLEFDPPMTSGLPAPPEASLIVRKNDAGAWHD
ncbi:MAG: YncE family protein, partial [Planctomycetota bacterium]